MPGKRQRERNAKKPTQRQAIQQLQEQEQQQQASAAAASASGASKPGPLGLSTPTAEGLWFPDDSGSEDDDSEDDDRSEDDENAYVAVAIDRSFEPPEPAAAAPGWGYRVRDSEAEWGEWQPASSATHAVELVQAELPEDAEAQALSSHRLYNQVGRGSRDGARKACTAQYSCLCIACDLMRAGYSASSTPSPLPGVACSLVAARCCTTATAPLLLIM